MFEPTLQTKFTGQKKDHDEFESEVTRYLESRGFLVASSTYHEIMPKEIQDRLKKNYSLTSLYIRGRADRIAVHKHIPLVFEWEAKTHKTEGRHDCLVESLPFVHHVYHSRLGVNCLYAYWDIHTGLHAGFWMHNEPTIRVALIPEHPQMTSEDLQQLQSTLMPYLVEKKVDYTTTRPSSSPYASNDAYFIIDEKEISARPSWKDLIEETLSKGHVPR